MSLRFRLTLLSTLVMGVIFAIFGTLAYFSVSYFLYESVDDNLDRQVTATLIYGPMWQGDISQLGVRDEINNVFYTAIDKDGRIYPYPARNRNIFISEELFSKALDGQTNKITTNLDGTTVRILSAPIPLPNGEIGGVLQAMTPLETTDKVLQQLGVFLGVTALVLVVVAAGGSYLLTGRTLRAVDAVTRKAHQIEVSQDLSQRIPAPGSNDEVGNLTNTFNRMLARLQVAFEAQRRFVADSSHELRTPLTVIKSNLNVLARTKDPQERAELIETSQAEVSRLNRMVNDLLYMAQMQAGHNIQPVLRPVEMDSLLLDVFARSRAIASLKGQKVALAHEDIAATLGDRDQLDHLLSNLVDNATKYTQEGGTITLGLWIEGDWARLEVGDNGPGIAPEEIPLVFERFYRSPNARNAERSGSGLGLAIVKSITEAHGGRIEVFSQLGEGTTFRLWLPLLGQQALPPDEDVLEEDGERIPTQVGRESLPVSMGNPTPEGAQEKSATA